MPNVERGLEVCAEVGLRGCKRCPFIGSQYCTSLLAQGALTMIKGLRDDYTKLKDKRPTVNDELYTLIKATVNALNTGDATRKVEVSRSDAEKLASFLSASLEASNRVSLRRTIPWGFSFSEDGLTERLALAIRKALDFLGHADPEETGREGCHCLMCNTKRELHEAYIAYADAHGEEAARAELDRRTSRENIRRELRNDAASAYAVAYQSSSPVVEGANDIPFGIPMSADDIESAMNSESEESQSEEPQTNTEANVEPSATPNVEPHDESSNAEPNTEAPRNNLRNVLNELRGLLRGRNVRYQYGDYIELNNVEEPRRSDR